MDEYLPHRGPPADSFDGLRESDGIVLYASSLITVFAWLSGE